VPKDSRPPLGFCFDRTHPAPLVVDMARRAEAGGLDELWLIEDCFYTSGPSLAATALAVTERLNVGIGILPAVARTAAVTAMEIATLACLAPGRFHAGIGHGVQEWMGQMGARTPSPLTTLDEVITTVRRLLRGERVSFDGREVYLRDVQLDQPPDPVPLVSAGVRGPKSLALAGRVADGTIMAEFAGPSYVEWASTQIAPTGPHRITVFAALCMRRSKAEAIADLSHALGPILEESNEAIRRAPFVEDLQALVVQHGGVGAAQRMPVAWWDELAAVGTPDDALAFAERLGTAGSDAVAFFPAPKAAIAELAELSRFVTNRSLAW
jgi:5,10-methylenetetrahydromethanopterin reductase